MGRKNTGRVKHAPSMGDGKKNSGARKGAPSQSAPWRTPLQAPLRATGMSPLLFGRGPADEGVAESLQQAFHVTHAFPEVADVGVDASHVVAYVPHFALDASPTGQHQSCQGDSYHHHGDQDSDQVSVHHLGSVEIYKAFFRRPSEIVNVQFIKRRSWGKRE